MSKRERKPGAVFRTLKFYLPVAWKLNKRYFIVSVLNVIVQSVLPFIDLIFLPMLVDALCQPDACRFQIINSLWTAQAARSMSIQSLLYVKYMNNSNLFLWASPSFLPLCAKSGKTGGLPPVFPHKTILFYSSTRRRFSDAMACRSASEQPIRSSSKMKF